MGYRQQYQGNIVTLVYIITSYFVPDGGCGGTSSCLTTLVLCVAASSIELFSRAAFDFVSNAAL